MTYYEVWGAFCDDPSEWDGGGSYRETYDTYKDAQEAVKEQQKGGHAAWIVEVE